MKHCHNHKCTVIHEQDDCPVCDSEKIANEIVENLCNQVDEQKVKVMDLQERNNILSIALENAIKRPKINILSE